MLTVATVNPVRRRLLGCAAAALLAACGNLETHTLDIQIAATGTRLEAEQVVALVYAQAPDAAIAKLLYSGGDLTRAVRRLRDRHAQLKPWLERGVIGNSDGGFMILRDSARRAELDRLLTDENNDRAMLHEQVAIAVGHGGPKLIAWLPYVAHSFGKEWQERGAASWWRVDAWHVWRRADNVGADDTPPQQ